MLPRAFMLAGAIAATVALSVACAQAPAPAIPAAGTPAAGATTPQATPKPAVPQRLTAVIPDVGPDIDPYSPGQPFSYYLSGIFEGIGTLNSGEARPELAASWRNIDPTTWEFRLRESRFSNGDPVTAEDVKFSIERTLDAQTSSPTMVAITAGVTAVEAPDPRTLIVRTRTPDPILANRVARVWVYQKKQFEQLGRQVFNANPMGSGPMRVSNFQPRQSITLVPNEQYAGANRWGLTELTLRGAPEASTRVAALRSGEAELAERIDQDQVRELTGNLRPVTTIFPVQIVIWMDTNEPQYRDRRARLALNHAIDRDTIVRSLLNNLTQPAQGQPVTSNTFGFNPNVRAYAYDEGLARRLLAEAGLAEGWRMQIGFTGAQTNFRVAAEAMTPYLARIGVRAELAPYDNAQFQAGFRTNRLGPIVISAVTAAELQDPAVSLSSLSSLPGQGSGRWSDPEYDRLFQQQASELDTNRRRQIIQEMMVIVNREAPILPLWGFWNTWGLSDKVDGFQVAPTGLPSWNTVVRTRG